MIDPALTTLGSACRTGVVEDDASCTVCDMDIGMIVVDGAFTSGVTAVLDVVHVAALQAPEVAPSLRPPRIRVLAERDQIHLGDPSVTLDVDAGLETAGDHDVVVVAALGALDADQLASALPTPDVRHTIEVVGGLDGPRLAAACTGTFALGDAGVLDGGRATTSWWLSPVFRSRYPDVQVDDDAMVVDDERALTAGAAFAHVDLALAIVADASPMLADRVARALVLDRRPSQASYAAIGQLRHDDTLVREFERWVRDHLAEDIDLAHLAAELGVTRRTLQRRTRSALGRTPLDVVQRLRIEHAEHLLATTERTLGSIATDVGYASASSLRRLLTRAGH